MSDDYSIQFHSKIAKFLQQNNIAKAVPKPVMKIIDFPILNQTVKPTPKSATILPHFPKHLCNMIVKGGNKPNTTILSTHSR